MQASEVKSNFGITMIFDIFKVSFSAAFVVFTRFKMFCDIFFQSGTTDVDDDDKMTSDDGNDSLDDVIHNLVSILFNFF